MWIYEKFKSELKTLLQEEEQRLIRQQEELTIQQKKVEHTEQWIHHSITQTNSQNPIVTFISHYWNDYTSAVQQRSEENQQQIQQTNTLMEELYLLKQYLQETDTLELPETDKLKRLYAFINPELKRKLNFTNQFSGFRHYLRGVES